MIKWLLRLALLTCTTTAGCFPEWNFGGEVVFGQTDINVLDPVQIRLGGRIQGAEYRFTADRGVVENPELDTLATYYAPYTGGADTVHVSVFDRFHGTTVGQQDIRLLVNGETLSYVDTKGKTLGTFDNGSVRISPVRGYGRSVTLGEGRMPAISPDGRFIAYVKYFGDGTSQIYMRDPAGGERNITNHQSFNVDPAWAPIDSSRQLVLVFSSDRISNGQGASQPSHSDHFNLWRVNVDTGDLSPVTTMAASARQPSWSPDGRFIAFSSNLDNDQSKDYWNLFLMELQSGRLTKLTAEATPNFGAYEPSLSPKGNRLAYTRKYLRPLRDQHDPLQKIFVMDVPAESLVTTSQTASNGVGQFVMNQEDPRRVESFPSWSPDGNELAFVQTKGSETRVFRVSANPPGSGFNSDQMAEVGVFNAIEARWSRQNFIADSNGSGNYNSVFTIPK